MVQNVCHDGDSAETFLQLGRKADVPSLHAETSSPESEWFFINIGAVAELVGIEGGVVSGVINLESSGVEASDWRPRHDEQYHEA